MPAARTRTSIVRLVALVFTAALAVVVVAQLVLMSVLDEDRAADAARSVAESSFAADLVDDAVRRAVVPVAGQEVGAAIAQQASTDPRVADVLAQGLVDAHATIVDPDAVGVTGSPEVAAVIDQVVDDAEARTGVELDDLRRRLDVPTLDPRYVPDAGARPIVEGVRSVAALVAAAAAVAVVALHPRRGRALAGIGIRAVVVCGVSAVVLLAIGWVISRTADTLFGRLVDDLWRSTVPSMLLFVGAGAVLGAGLGVGGLSIDGLSRPEHDEASW